MELVCWGEEDQGPRRTKDQGGPRTKEDQGPKRTKDQGGPRTKEDQGPKRTKDQRGPRTKEDQGPRRTKLISGTIYPLAFSLQPSAFSLKFNIKP